MDRYIIRILKESTNEEDTMRGMVLGQSEDIKFEGRMNADDCIEILQHLNHLITEQK